MSASSLIIAVFLSAWVLLTVSMILQHVADRDGVTAILWALVPTAAVLGLSVLFSRGYPISYDVLQLSIAGGLFILSGVNFTKSLRRLKAARA